MGLTRMTHIGIKGNYLADFQITSGFLALSCTVSTLICTWLAKIKIMWLFFRLLWTEFRNKILFTKWLNYFLEKISDNLRARNLQTKSCGNMYSQSNLIDIGKDYLTNYYMFSETNRKLNVALMLHQNSREKIFSRSELIRISFPGNSWDISWIIFYSENHPKVIWKIAK